MGFRFWGRKKTVRAQEFVLEDGEGRERAALRTDAVGNSLLLFRGPDGRVRCFLGATPDGTPRMALFYGNGEGTVQLEANDHLNTAALVISAPGGKAKIVLAVTASGLPAIVVYDESGAKVISEHVAAPHHEESAVDHGLPDWDSFFKG